MKRIILFILFIPFCKDIFPQLPIREMRAVWIATVENIDWPSSRNLSSADQKQEMIELLDLVKEHGLNTVIFQIRPCTDAFYESPYEPWSVWLTGEQGKAPVPYYDPLEFVISECRERGLDIHVWLNPYRALRDTARYKATSGHITQLHPEWFLQYGNTLYFDPGLPETREHVTRVVGDIVSRYDIDAVHMDDYFYPYRIAGQPFPDDSSFAMYGGSYTEQQRDDWRRNNVDLIVQMIHDSIRAIKPWVEFGISPFGVWRNADRDSTGSATRAGQTNYDDLFADILKWQKKGWIDYVVPQIYWHIGFNVADYRILADWWNRNTFGCPLYIGQAFYRIDKKSEVRSWRDAGEILDQVSLNRKLVNVHGSMFFSAKYLRTSPGGLNKMLVKKAFQYPSLVPSNRRIKTIMPEKPGNAYIRVNNDSIHMSWERGENVKNFIVYRFRIGSEANRSDPETIINITSATSFTLRKNCKTRLSRYYYVVTSQSNTNQESEPVLFRLR